MSEPKYDEDLVNLGYLKKVIDEFEEISLPENISRNYGSRPNPPYYKGDTWVNGTTVYTCVNTRTIGVFTASDWATESGARTEARNKNKIYLTQPSNYQVGDMWILQTDNDHRAGKKGEILITTVGRQQYNENDWVNMLSYGSIASINEFASNINEILDNLEISKESGVLKVIYSDEIPLQMNENDLWFVTGDTGNYEKGQLYKYNGTTFDLIDDEDIANTFGEANQSVITADGQIQIFYEVKDNVIGMSVGDLCNDNGNLYRYNGTNWISVYDVRVEDIKKNLEVITNRTLSISTDLGNITQTVRETSATIDDITGEMTTISEEISNIIQTQEQWQANFSKMGGNNLFYYDLGLWNSYSGIEEYSDTEFKNSTASGIGYIIGSGSSVQNIEVLNGLYTVSFKYKKIGSQLANASVKINGTVYPLTETEWTNFAQTLDVTTNHIEVEFTADTINTLYVADLMGNVGVEASAWTQNPNEVRTDTVTIRQRNKSRKLRNQHLYKNR